MPAAVFDTNVLSVAEGRYPLASPECELECSRLLGDVIDGEVIAVIDDASRILTEYRNNVETKTSQLRVGGRFLIWLLQNRWNPQVCEQVAITLLPGSVDGCDFAEFPTDPDLHDFDRDDRKFVAVVVASALGPRVEEATDSGWWLHRVSLAANGIEVRFPCPGLVQD